MKKIVLEKNIIDEIIRLYTEEMLGSPSISEKIGIHKTVIIRILKENSVDVGKSGRKFKGGKSESDKRYYVKNKEKRLRYFSDWQKENYEHRKKYMDEYREKNIDRIRMVKRTYEKTRKANDPIYKLIANFRTAIYQVLKENNLQKNGHYFEILGYSPEELITHLEKKFVGEMSWENYGTWHVDHIRPIVSFEINEINDEEFVKCWSLENLQPMWGEDNIRKGGTIL
jgi:hypothetical protein